MQGVNGGYDPVLVVSYMRTGSSFLSRALFLANQHVYYHYEPLAALYSAMYGLRMDMVVDTDVMFNRDGRFR